MRLCASLFVAFCVTFGTAWWLIHPAVHPYLDALERLPAIIERLDSYLNLRDWQHKVYIRTQDEQQDRYRPKSAGPAPIDPAPQEEPSDER